MKFKNILLLYKRSAYKIYFLEHKKLVQLKHWSAMKKEIARFKRAHDDHYAALKLVARALMSEGLSFHETYRGRDVDYSKYDLIITVGGDGTFLEASREIKHQIIIGVNSAPEHSVGRFCLTTADRFPAALKKIVAGQFRIRKLHRLEMALEGRRQKIRALNDILICHKNPAVLCRYYLKVRGEMEEQRSSGIWISTAAGSTGAIRSSGGKILDPYSRQMQYIPRELYRGNFKPYRLKGGILNGRQSVSVVSLMRRGKIYMDGAHYDFDFPYGATVKVSLSAHPVKTLELTK